MNGEPAASSADYRSTPARLEQTDTIEFQLSLPGFEGPVQTLLRLAEREQLDVSTISLVEVIDQFLTFFRAQSKPDAVELADFVAVAARLLLLKSRHLLPRRSPPEIEEDEPPGLAQAIEDYMHFRAAGAALRERSAGASRLYPRSAPPLPVGERPMKKLQAAQLLMVMQELLERLPDEPAAAVMPAERLSVAAVVSDIMECLRVDRMARFSAIISRCRSRLEVLVSFVAILHLVRDDLVQAEQLAPFGEIVLRLVDARSG